MNGLLPSSAHAGGNPELIQRWRSQENPTSLSPHRRRVLGFGNSEVVKDAFRIDYVDLSPARSTRRDADPSEKLCASSSSPCKVDAKLSGSQWRTRSIRKHSASQLGYEP